MADEAFALSPISARAAPPSEADFDAIREAFMETSRGRWFLAEYAKRNRNADTAMVLDAVARIEQTVAAQQQAVPDDALPKALAAIRSSLAEARAAAAAAFDKRTRDDALAPIEKGVRIIREISWRWREIGGDSRICDLLDSQAGAIEKVHAQLAARDDTAALHAAFGLIETTLDELPDSPAATASPPRTETASSPPATGDEALASPEETAAPKQAVVDAAVFESETAATTLHEAQVDAIDGAMTTNGHPPADAMNEQDMAHDDAVLDMIALEMGAPDFDEPETDYPGIGDPVIAEPELAIEPIAGSDDARIDRVSESMPEIAAPPSLGASLLASGIVQRATTRSDPLAPIRRMTQAEKIAFFS
ncbi:hypothetical protein [Nitrobacter hamburgensis]|nr:hypothetical protein [Nitrobacter hamburgensis]